MADSKVFINKMQKLTETNLNSRSNTLQNYINKYIDRNSEVLFDLGPNKRLFFSDPDKQIAFFCTGLNEKDVTQIIKESEFIDSSWQILSNPFNLTCVMAIRYYAIKKNKKAMENMIMYLTCFFYASIHFKYFKYEPQPNIMAYTINNLSNKYLIKQTGNLFDSMKQTSMTCHNTYEKNLINGSDLELKNYIVAFRSRLDGLIQNIANEYYDNRDAGNYLNTEEDNYSEENYHINDNTSFKVKDAADRTMLRVTSRNVDVGLVQMSAKMCGVSVNVTRTALIEITREKTKEIREVIEIILQLYLESGKNKADMIGSKHFINYCLDLYIKSNTSDKGINRIKDLLNIWLNECSDNYRKTERQATLNNFRKAIYMYFVFNIQQAYIS